MSLIENFEIVLRKTHRLKHILEPAPSIGLASLD